MKRRFNKFITIGIMVCAFLGHAVVGKAATVTVDPTQTWFGYMNVFNLPSVGGGFQFGSGWGPADLRASFGVGTNSSILTLSPNTIGDSNAYWYTPSGATGSVGNKIMHAQMYVQPADGTFTGTSLTFTGNVLANTLTAPTNVDANGNGWTSVAFIRDYFSDFSSFNQVTVPLNEGAFSITLNTINDPTRHIQYGFETIGPNVWATDVAQFGSIQVAPYRPLTITAPTLSKTYGDLDPLPFTPTFASDFFATGDSSTSLASASQQPTCSRTAGEDAGTYPITCPGAVDAYYNPINYVSGSLTISQKLLTVSVDPTSMTYGDTPPALTTIVNGVVNADTVNVSCPAPVTSASPVGSYQITCPLNATIASNYALSTNNLVFSVTKAPSTVAITCPATVNYTGSPLTPCNATVTGANGLNQSVDIIYSNNTNVGTATATATYAGDANHEGSNIATDNFTINTITYTITTSASPTFGGGSNEVLIVNEGDIVTVVATANPGYSFVNWTENGVKVSTASSYVFTVDANRALVANFADITPPSSPQALNATPTTPLSFSLSWNASTDGVGVTGYQVFRNGLQIGTTSSTSFVDTGLACGISYSYGVAAIDAAGNIARSANADASTSPCAPVFYSFTGFFSPLALAPPQLNLWKAGIPLPIRFSLGGDKGKNIFAAGYPQSVKINCSTGLPVGSATATAPYLPLIYNSTTSVYTYTSKTKEDWKKTCRQFKLKFNDGSTVERVVNVKFIDD